MPRATAPVYLCPLLVGFAVALLFTAALRIVAPRLGMVDHPSARKDHGRPMPVLGGVAVYLGVALGSVLFAHMSLRVAWLLGGSALMVLVGLWDDRVGLRVSTRLSLQVLAAGGMIAAGLGFRWFGWAPADCLVSALWLIGLTNALNCLDCCDGIAAGVAGIAATAFFVIALGAGHGNAALMAAALLGACAGFAVFNLPPASIFLGNSGSALLGFLLGGLAMEATRDLPAATQAWAAVLPVAVPVWDIVVVHAGRWRAGTHGLRALLESTGHDHLPHRLRQHALTPRQTAVAVYLMAASLALSAALLVRRPGGVAVMAVLAAAALACGERPFASAARRLAIGRAAPAPAAGEHARAAAE
jgi:UDP-GlcNAc:undecaprenyl-phosphate GlcNAc-1-phosphate transferase